MYSVIWAKVKDFEEYNRKYKADERFKEVVDALGNFYEGVGVIVKEGFMDIRLVALMWGGPGAKNVA
jgi:biotin synthase-related radical SAM superfamily protein